MHEREYLSQCDKNEERFQVEYDADMESLDQYINDAYAILEQAQSVLFFKRDIFSSCMDKAEFDNLVISKIRELL